VSVFYTHFSFSCEINELFKCQRIRGQETPNEQLVTTTKRANNKNESSQEKTIKRFSPFYESVPRPSVFFFLAQCEYAHSRNSKSNLPRHRERQCTDLVHRALSASKGRGAGRGVKTQTRMRTSSQGPRQKRGLPHTYTYVYS